MRKKIALGLIIVMFLSLLPQNMGFSTGIEYVLANEISFSKLEEVKGGVFITKGGGIRELKGRIGMAITQGDTVRTDGDGSATLVFKTGSKMFVGPNTLFTINKAQETKNGGEKISVKLKSGSVWSNVHSLINGEDEYQIETPTTVMRARGTLFLASVNPATGETTASVMEGAVGVQRNGAGNLGQNEQLVPMGKSIHLPPFYDQDMRGVPEPQPQPVLIDLNQIIENQNASILVTMAVDMIERLQEIEEQTQSYLAVYKTTQTKDYLIMALQLAHIDVLLVDLYAKFMGTIEGTEQERQMNEILERYSTNVENFRKQTEQLQQQLQASKDKLVEDAKEAGIRTEVIEGVIQSVIKKSPTASGSVDSGLSVKPSPSVMPSPPLTPPTPHTPPSAGGGESQPIALRSIGAISGIAKVGSVLTAGPVTPIEAIVTYQWLRADEENGKYTEIPGATSKTYTLNETEIGKFIRVRATGIGNFTSTVLSVPTAEIAGPDIEIVPISDFRVDGKTETTAVFKWTTIVGATKIELHYSEDGANWSTYSGNPLPQGADQVLAEGLSLHKDYWFKLVVSIGNNNVDSNIVKLCSTFAGGQGTRENPYLIAKPHHLSDIRDYLDMHFKLTTDISFSNVVEEWEPIGTQDHPFQGFLDGDGHSINGLTVKIEGANQGYSGLFGYTDSNAVIKNVKLNNANIRGIDGVGGLVAYNCGLIEDSQVSGRIVGNTADEGGNGSEVGVGGLVGYNQGTIIRCETTGSIEANVHVGGLVGKNEGSISYSKSSDIEISGNNNVGGLVGSNLTGGEIKYSSAHGQVNGYYNNIGGLVGKNDGMIYSCYTSGSVLDQAVSGEDNVGGLVGFNHGPISDSYSCYAFEEGVVGESVLFGVNWVGGLIGYNTDATISNTYAANSVTGESFVGGLIGFNNNDYENIISSYWDASVSGPVNSTYGTGFQDKEELRFHISSKWDFLNTWDWDSSSGYPMLKQINDFGLNLQVTNITVDSVTFAWTVPQMANEIVIESSLDLENWNECETEEVITTAATTATVVNLAPNTQYFFRIFIRGNGFEGYSKITHKYGFISTE